MTTTAKANKGVWFSDGFHNLIQIKHAIVALKPRRRGRLTRRRRWTMSSGQVPPAHNLRRWHCGLHGSLADSALASMVLGGMVEPDFTISARELFLSPPM